MSRRCQPNEISGGRWWLFAFLASVGRQRRNGIAGNVRSVVQCVTQEEAKHFLKKERCLAGRGRQTPAAADVKQTPASGSRANRLFPDGPGRESAGKTNAWSQQALCYRTSLRAPKHLQSPRDSVQPCGVVKAAAAAMEGHAGLGGHPTRG